MQLTSCHVRSEGSNKRARRPPDRRAIVSRPAPRSPVRWGGPNNVPGRPLVPRAFAPPPPPQPPPPLNPAVRVASPPAPRHQRLGALVRALGGRGAGAHRLELGRHGQTEKQSD